MNKEQKNVLKIILIIFFMLVFIFLCFLFLDYLKVDCEVNPPMVSNCERYNIEELNNCVREGYTGTGFLGMTDWHTIYWVCEGYGKVAQRCIEYGESSPSNLTADWEHCK